MANLQIREEVIPVVEKIKSSFQLLNDKARSAPFVLAASAGVGAFLVGRSIRRQSSPN
jgi:hypothetical protein